MGNNIVLIGMPSCGKTTIGLALSKVLADYTFIDTDDFIEKTYGMTIAEIFKKHSEDYFRKLEYDAIKLVCSGKKKIISIGRSVARLLNGVRQCASATRYVHKSHLCREG